MESIFNRDCCQIIHSGRWITRKPKHSFMKLSCWNSAGITSPDGTNQAIPHWNHCFWTTRGLQRHTSSPQIRQLHNNTLASKKFSVSAKQAPLTIQWLHAIATNAQVSGFTCLALNWRQGQNGLGCAHHAVKKTGGESQVNLMPHVKLFVCFGSRSLNSQMDCCLLGTKPSVTSMLISDWSIEGFGLFQYCDIILLDIKIPIIEIRRSTQSYLYNGNAVPIYIETGPINYLCCYTISIEPSICQLHPPIK